ncbi:S1 family peptidase [Streptomyces laculatispora]|uniref:S1 family peptidase n=1 Tax=Streptomyces laculatispora TaxID=887464 RepID=A0ABY9ICC9_9ACTN|nr:S1 family peptidase [Streptomyces laculatispora]WLQ43276.1 S1 family peptidase [Streptomyces laculatispora]
MGLLLAAPSASSASGPEAPAEVSVFLNSEKHNVDFSSPTLDRIKKSAKADGSSLQVAVDNYLANPSTASRLTIADEPDGPVSTPNSSIDLLTAGELEDIEAMAAEDGLSLEEGINRYAWQAEFVAVADELEALYPDTFSGAEKLDTSAWFAFKGAAPAKALELASSLPVPVEVVSNRQYSEAELARVMEIIAREWEKKNGVRSFSTAYEIRSGGITVDVEYDDAATASRLSAGEADGTPETAGDPRFPVTVNVSAGSGLIQQDNYIRGGGGLSGCTAGFNLKYISTDTKRLGTAGHCTTGTTSKYSNHSSAGGSTTVDVVWSSQGSWGDLGYTNHGTKTPTRTFYHDWNKTRYADNRSTMPTVGTSVCHFGTTSGKRCSTVKYRDVTISSLKHMVLTNSNVSAGGDSGGPWYHGGTAVGIHTGIVSKGGAVRSVFTPAYLFQNRGYDVWQR